MKTTTAARAVACAAAAILLLMARPLPGRQQAATPAPENRQSWFRSIVVEPGQNVADAVCYFCNVIVRGQLSGDAVALWGSITVAQNATVEGDAVAIGGGAALGAESKVGGDVVALGGSVEKASSATVAEDVESQWWLYFAGQREIYWRGALLFAGVVMVSALLGYGATRGARFSRMTTALATRWGMCVIAGISVALAAGVLYWLLLKIPGAVAWGYATLSFVLFLAALPGFAAVASGLGRRAAPCCPTALPSALCGALVLALTMMLPIAGLAVFGIVALLSWGTVVTAAVARANPA